MWPYISVAGLHVPTYTLIISLVSCLGLLWMYKRAQQFKLEEKTAIDLTVVCLIGGFIGARLLHVFYEDADFYSHSWMDAFKIWQGGFVFYGGLLLGAACGVFYLHWKKQKLWMWADVSAPVLAMGYAIGRLACFANGCCYGKICDLPWAVHFKSHQYWGLEVLARHPTQVYAAMLELALVCWLLFREKKSHVEGSLFLIWGIGHGLNRMLMETLRDDPRGQLIFGLGLSFWLALFTVFIASLILWAKKRHQRH